MTTLRQRLENTSKEVQANWPFYSNMFDNFLKDYVSLPGFTKNRTNEEIGIVVKAVGEIRSKIQESTQQYTPPPASSIKKLQSITRIKHD